MDFSPHFVTIALHLFSIRINHKISEFSAPLPDITNRSVSVNVVTIFIFSVATLNSLFTLTHSDTKKRGQTSDLLSPDFISSKFSFLFFTNRLSSYIKSFLHQVVSTPGSVTVPLLLHQPSGYLLQLVPSVYASAFATLWLAHEVFHLNILPDHAISKRVE